MRSSVIIPHHEGEILWRPLPDSLRSMRFSDWQVTQALFPSPGECQALFLAGCECRALFPQISQMLLFLASSSFSHMHAPIRTSGLWSSLQVRLSRLVLSWGSPHTWASHSSQQLLLNKRGCHALLGVPLPAPQSVSSQVIPLTLIVSASQQQCHPLPDVQCLKKHCFNIFVWSVACLRQESKSVHYSLLDEGANHFYTHRVSWLQAQLIFLNLLKSMFPSDKQEYGIFSFNVVFNFNVSELLNYTFKIHPLFRDPVKCPSLCT